MNKEMYKDIIGISAFFRIFSIDTLVLFSENAGI